MKGSILDFLELVEGNQELAKEVVELAARHGFEFGDELTAEELEALAGGTSAVATSEYQHLDQAANQQMQALARLTRTLGAMRTQVGLAGQKY